MTAQRILRTVSVVAGVLVLLLSPALLVADTFVQTNLVANTSGIAAQTDPNLINPWGMSFSATSPFWVSDQGSGVSTLYSAVGVPSSLIVTIPGSAPPSGPTGTVQNSTASSFVLGDGTKASFLFDTLSGTIAGWNSGEGTTAAVVATTPGAVYTGLALGSVGADNYLYAADSTGHINVFNTNFNNVSATTFAGKFVDPSPIAGYTPFNIQLINGNLYVTYADLGPHGVAIPGSTGYVDEYDTSGNFIARLATGGALFAPWGITVAPSTFGSFGNDFLIGNFGNGLIDAYSSTGVFEGALEGIGGTPIQNNNLWALDFRPNDPGVDANALYITAGIDDQNGGLFAEITETPELNSLLLTGSGLLALAFLRRHLRTA